MSLASCLARQVPCSSVARINTQPVYLGGYGLDSRRAFRFYLCPTLVTNEHIIFFIIYLSCCLRYASAADCEVSLPQHSSGVCMAIRNAALAQNQKTFTFKQASHGFALLNMTIPEVGALALKDPFTRYYTSAYVGMTQANTKILEQYNNATFGQEITDILDYLKISEFFQSVLEPVVGVSAINVSFSVLSSFTFHLIRITKSLNALIYYTYSFRNMCGQHLETRRLLTTKLNGSVISSSLSSVWLETIPCHSNG